MVAQRSLSSAQRVVLCISTPLRRCGFRRPLRAGFWKGWERVLLHWSAGSIYSATKVRSISPR